MHIIISIIIVLLIWAMFPSLLGLLITVTVGAVGLILISTVFWILAHVLAGLSPNFVAMTWMLSPIGLLLAAYAYAYSAEIDEFVKTRINH